MKNFDAVSNLEHTKIHKNGHAFALLLPVPPFREEFPDNVSIEFLFKDECFSDSNGNGLITEKDISIIANGKKVDNLEKYVQLDLLKIPTSLKIIDGKVDFAEKVVPNLKMEDFKEFEKLFKRLESIISLFKNT